VSPGEPYCGPLVVVLLLNGGALLFLLLLFVLARDTDVDLFGGNRFRNREAPTGSWSSIMAGRSKWVQTPEILTAAALASRAPRPPSPIGDIPVNDLIDVAKTTAIPNDILKAELAGVVRYTHYSLVITGPNRLPLVEFMQAQAAESLLHAQQAGEILTGLGGHPEQGIAHIEESHDHSLECILRESIAHERAALSLYRDLLGVVQDQSIYLEEYCRGQIGAEEMHLMEMAKLLRDYAV
jgi:bacterioferritin